MDEETTRAIVKAGMLHTSDEFVGKTMHKIAQKSALRREFASAFAVGCSCCVFILVLFGAGSYAFTVMGQYVPAFCTRLAGVVIVIFLLNQLIVIRERLAADRQRKDLTSAPGF